MIVSHTFPCAFCRKPVTTIWDDNDDGTTNGMMRDPLVVLVADWVFHSQCWDIMTSEYQNEKSVG